MTDKRTHIRRSLRHRKILNLTNFFKSKLLVHEPNPVAFYVVLRPLACWDCCSEQRLDMAVCLLGVLPVVGYGRR